MRWPVYLSFWRMNLFITMTSPAAVWKPDSWNQPCAEARWCIRSDNLLIHPHEQRSVLYWCTKATETGKRSRRSSSATTYFLRGRGYLAWSTFSAMCCRLLGQWTAATTSSPKGSWKTCADPVVWSATAARFRGHSSCSPAKSRSRVSHPDFLCIASHGVYILCCV